MASGTADLQRDLGGAVMQSIFGALLTAGYAAAVTTDLANAPNSAQITSSVQNELTKSFSSAADVAQQYPQYAQQIIAGARSSFLDGADWAYTAGIIAVLVGAAIVFFLVPRKEQEEQLLADYHAEDTRGTGADDDAARTTGRAARGEARARPGAHRALPDAATDGVDRGRLLDRER
jgi:MFS transporter, DHA2 family, multidrug resistance protein